MLASSGNAALTTIDLFCGAGGITEGFRQARFRCLYANDVNQVAISTFRANHPEVWAESKPVETVDPAAIRRALRLTRGELGVLVGGPPCQGFSINAPERFLGDPRNALFAHFIRFIDEFFPQTFVFENVPGMLSLAQGKIFERIIAEFQRRHYAVSTQILFAAHYGVPQQRWRLIILGSRSGPAPAPPMPTHFAVARANFKGGRTMALRPLPLEEQTLLPAVTVRDAISDLPRLRMGQGAEVVSYDQPARSEYATSLRSTDGKTFNHFAARLSPQNVRRLRFVKPGGSWRDIPFELLPKGMQKARKSDHTRRYGRLRHEGLAGTIMTKCDPHWGAVFLPDQDRALTVREAARLQSFPDAYRFLGSRVAQYEQVGNAVPPLLARAIAGALAEHLAKGRRRAKAS